MFGVSSGAPGSPGDAYAGREDPGAGAIGGLLAAVSPGDPTEGRARSVVDVRTAALVRSPRASPDSSRRGGGGADPGRRRHVAHPTRATPDARAGVARPDPATPGQRGSRGAAGDGVARRVGVARGVGVAPL